MSDLSKEVAELLRCPITGQPLRLASERELTQFPENQSDAGYVTEDGKLLYPVINGFPTLVGSEALKRSLA